MLEKYIQKNRLYSRLHSELSCRLISAPKFFKSGLEEALSQGFPIDFRDSIAKNTLLEWAASFSSKGGEGEVYDDIGLLLDYGADPNIRDRFGFSPLARVVLRRGSIALIERLIHAGADVNARNEWGQTAFCFAADEFTAGFAETDEADRVYGLNAVRILLDNGADPYLCDRWTKPNKGISKEERRRRKRLKKWVDGYIRQRESAEPAAKEDEEGFMR